MLFLTCWKSFPCLSCYLGSIAGVLCRCLLRFTALSSLDHCSPKTWVSHNITKIKVTLIANILVDVKVRMDSFCPSDEKGHTIGAGLAVQTPVWVAKWVSPFLGCFSLKRWNRGWGGMKYHHRNQEGKCRNPTSNSELYLAVSHCWKITCLCCLVTHNYMTD